MTKEEWSLSIGAILVISGIVIIGASWNSEVGSLIGALVGYSGILITLLTAREDKI